ncbi:hypothetical protein MSAN_01899900 [Mycena sanguinolenta]|uniref:Uncharacterized protein n=1 Tax=Mycena sanguinolenta TaxID=230812 RepID=A0A8H6XPS4_9AGAR|nr:hypothetical protein MSAN_01899900 [Mycena sanguinolenta]
MSLTARPRTSLSAGEVAVHVPAVHGALNLSRPATTTRVDVSALALRTSSRSRIVWRDSSRFWGSPTRGVHPYLTASCHLLYWQLVIFRAVALTVRDALSGCALCTLFSWSPCSWTTRRAARASFRGF